MPNNRKTLTIENGVQHQRAKPHIELAIKQAQLLFQANESTHIDLLSFIPKNFDEKKKTTPEITHFP